LSEPTGVQFYTIMVYILASGMGIPLGALQLKLIVFFISAACILAAVLAFHASRLRAKVIWAGSYVIMCCGGILWLLSNLARLISISQTVWKISTCSGALGLSLASFGLMVFSVQISQRRRKIPKPFWYSFPPTLGILLLLVFTNDVHHWMWTQWPAPAPNIEQTGFMYAIFLFVIYSQVVIGLTTLVRSFLTRDGFYRAQTGLLIIGVMIPVVIGLAEDLLNLTIINGIDEAALGIIVTIGIFALATLRFESFTVIPVAYKLMVDSMQDGMVVLDLEEHVLASNPAAVKFLSGALPVALGTPFEVVLSRWSSEAQTLWKTGTRDFEIGLSGETNQNFRFSTRELVEDKAESAGKMVMIYDITQQKQIEARLQELAINDPLTGCFNRGHFMECAGKQFRQAKRYHRPLSVAMIDLDHFKHINDEFGHAIGDRVLKRVVTACLASLRRSDLFARYGGEEFVLLMPETNEREAQLVAERLREAISGQFLQGASVTASLGVTSLDADEEIDLEHLLDRADQAQYRSKELGRDRVTIWKK
jgi:diguanylate cyclase (GGDEF)-like protein